MDVRSTAGVGEGMIFHTELLTRVRFILPSSCGVLPGMCSSREVSWGFFRRLGEGGRV
jgi:hypothetical protein